MTEDKLTHLNEMKDKLNKVSKYNGNLETCCMMNDIKSFLNNVNNNVNNQTIKCCKTIRMP